MPFQHDFFLLYTIDQKVLLEKSNEKGDALNTFWSPADEAASLLMYEMWTLGDKVT